MAGKQVHDANIVATMLVHGERRLAMFNIKDFGDMDNASNWCRWYDASAVGPLPRRNERSSRTLAVSESSVLCILRRR